MPRSPFGPVQNDGTVPPLRQPSILDVLFPMRGVRVHQEQVFPLWQPRGPKAGYRSPLRPTGMAILREDDRTAGQQERPTDHNQGDRQQDTDNRLEPAWHYPSRSLARRLTVRPVAKRSMSFGSGLSVRKEPMAAARTNLAASFRNRSRIVVCFISLES